MKIRFKGGQMHGFDMEIVTVPYISGPIRFNGELYNANGDTDGDYTVWEVQRNAG